MLAQNEMERERYEAQRKAQLDFNTGMKAARMEGQQEGRQEGEIIGTIHLCERLLNRPETPTEQLTSLTLDELRRLAANLENLTRKPN